MRKYKVVCKQSRWGGEHVSYIDIGTAEEMRADQRRPGSGIVAESIEVRLDAIPTNGVLILVPED